MDEIEELRGRVRRGPWRGGDLNDVFAQKNSVETVPGGVADDIQFTPDQRRFIQGGIYNGDFENPTPDTGADIHNTSNKLPGWEYTQVTGTTIAARWRASTASGSGGSVRFTLTSPSATDDTRIETIILIAPTYYRAYSYSAVAAFASGGGSSLDYYIEAQFLDADGATTGTAGTGESGTDEIVRAWPNGDGRPPADATSVRIRVGVTNSTSTTTRDLMDVSLNQSAMPTAEAPYGARAERTTDYSVPDATDRSVRFNEASIWDSDEMHDPSGSPEYLAIDIGSVNGGKSGYYLVGGGVEWDDDATGQRWLWINVNAIDANLGGSELAGSKVMVDATSGGVRTGMVTTGLIYLNENANTFVALNVRQNSGGALDIKRAGFWVQRLAGG